MSKTYSIVEISAVMRREEGKLSYEVQIE